ncbi:MAG: ABC transporter substrate-binding protein [Lachnospiraceae bacterium]|nr:ABC transporter substrate-binding protein [Lachnospiraceae bacterium]
MKNSFVDNRIRTAGRLSCHIFIFLIVSVFFAALTGCSKNTEQALTGAESEASSEGDEDLIVIGFSQIGAESDWRIANTQSMQATFTREKGYDLIFDDAQQKQSNQITAIRKFIQQDVNYIVLAPVTEEGWDTVLGEARDAGIPVIIVDRKVATRDEELFTCWVGSDFKLEGRKVCKWLSEFCNEKGIPQNSLKIVDIQGTEGSSAQIGRTNGLIESAWENGWTILDRAPGEYTQAKGREAASRLLEQYPDLNVIYCENDNEAFGAIEAVEAAGRQVGYDIAAGQIMVLSFDGVSDAAIKKARSGKIACIGECNPTHGPRVEKIIKDLEQGMEIKKFDYVDEEIFSGDDTVKTIEVDSKGYPITILGE